MSRRRTTSNGSLADIVLILLLIKTKNSEQYIKWLESVDSNKKQEETGGNVVCETGESH